MSSNNFDSDPKKDSATKKKLMMDEDDFEIPNSKEDIDEKIDENSLKLKEIEKKIQEMGEVC